MRISGLPIISPVMRAAMLLRLTDDVIIGGLVFGCECVTIQIALILPHGNDQINRFRSIEALPNLFQYFALLVGHRWLHPQS
jgi:hypothetical protein